MKLGHTRNKLKVPQTIGHKFLKLKDKKSVQKILKLKYKIDKATVLLVGKCQGLQIHDLR